MTENRQTKKIMEKWQWVESKIKMSRLNPNTSVKTVAINGLDSFTHCKTESQMIVKKQKQKASSNPSIC